METSAQHEARSFIERIGREHTLDGSVIGTRLEFLLSDCLEILSNQLYAKSTHFLLELIQNADDNTYDCASPTLSLFYEPGSLRIDCNEVGFTAANVEAICAINRSTKSDKTRDEEYIGEKGIGFKSVFKAADVVWIASREFTFKFDKTKFLGMVNPIWAEFPQLKRPEFTSTYLQLSENILIFLRRIKVINLRVKGQSERAVVKTESRQGDNTLVALRVGEDKFQYLVRSHTVKRLPWERRRPNRSQSKLLLAFPMVNFSEQPSLAPQNIYAFLPIRNYGLKFLIQGDFILTASREDIESTLPWNQTLRDAVTEAFLLSVRHFNEGELRYAWPHYLPSASTAVSSFLEPVVVSILSALRESTVIESCAEKMVKPSLLKYVSMERFADHEGNPFTLDAKTATRYLSLKYSTSTLEGLSAIGVSQLSPQEFLHDLASAAEVDPTAFWSRPAIWHSKLAQTLVVLASDAEFLPMIQDICLIPLHDGTWTSARGHVIFFSRNETSLEVPDGIEVLIMDSVAESDLNRRKLFTNLGVKTWEASEICRLIIEKHASTNFEPESLTRDQLISHALFLYEASWQPPKAAKIWFATTQDKRCLGGELYISRIAEVNSSAARIFVCLQGKFSVIHNDYLDTSRADKEWPLWLVNNLGLSMLPRLVAPFIDPEPQPIQDLPSIITSQDHQAQQMSPKHADQILSVARDERSIPSSESASSQISLQDSQTQMMLPERRERQRLMTAHQGENFSSSTTSSSGNHGLQDWHMQLMLLEQQNKKRLMMARLEQHESRIGEHSSQNKNNNNDEGSLRDIAQTKKKDDTVQSGLSSTPPMHDTQPEHMVSGKKIFALSEEFIFMFRECRTSDVLQLLRENWHYYSKWIDGAHMKWQNADFVESSTQLKSALGTCRVQTMKGSLSLQETILPAIDHELDEVYPIHVLDIEDPQHSEWTFLDCFGVLVKGNTDYYLRCLISISTEKAPDIDKLAYIYEQIQTRHKGNEELISTAFYEKNVVFVLLKSRGEAKSQGWLNMKECVSRGIDIESDYPSCSYLFRCLLAPGGNSMISAVAAARLITRSTSLEDISRIFRNINGELKGVSASTVTSLLQPIRNRAIVPITLGGMNSYDDLLTINDQSWFIADQPLIRESFLGKIPLLALPIEDIPALEDFLRLLRLENRNLSKSTTVITRPQGRIATHWDFTTFVRGRSPFIKALIPYSHDNRTNLFHQINKIRVSVATRISQIFLLKLAGVEIYSRPVRGQVSLSNTEGNLNFFMTDDAIADGGPPYDLIRNLADTCHITKSNHYSLLCMALSSSSPESIVTAFANQGINVKGVSFDRSKRRYLAQRRDLLHIPPSLWGEFNWVREALNGMGGPTNLRLLQTLRAVYRQGEDRRLPMTKIIGVGGLVDEGSCAGRLMWEPDSLHGWDHVQFLGEHMVSKLLQKYLGEAYDPERDWTSTLRSRIGHKSFEGSSSSAAFVLRESQVRAQMTAFVTKHGQSQTPDWEKKLQIDLPVYHLEVAVSTGSKSSSFFLSTSEFSTMQRYKMNTKINRPDKEVAVLVRISDLHSSDLSSISLFLDPWRLFESGAITLTDNWLLKATLRDGGSESMTKKRKIRTPSMAWATPMTPGRHLRSHTTRAGHRDTKAYTYRALNSEKIRLLYLFPGVQGDGLQGVIFHIDFHSNVTYQAMSYVWETDQRTKELATPDGLVWITPSLHKGLQRLRHANKATILWADAICINQDDNSEKAQQIRKMPAIFKMASHTCVFLQHDDQSDAALETLMQVRFKEARKVESIRRARAVGRADTDNDIEDDTGNTIEDDNDSNQKRDNDDEEHDTDKDDELFFKYWPKGLSAVPALWADRRTPCPDDDIWSAVRAFFELPWFRRVWILQEVVASSIVKIVCGKWIVDWEDLHRAVEIVEHEVRSFGKDFSQLEKSWEPFLSIAERREWEARRQRWPLIMLLESFRYAESTRGRDHFFALLGLASDGNEKAFEPDYDSPLEDIALRFARTFVRQQRGMQLLYRAGLNGQSSRFPSWVPDWTVKTPSGLPDSIEGGTPHSASGTLGVKMKCAPDTDELIVEGYVVDVIRLITKSANLEREWEHYFKEIDAMVDSLPMSLDRVSQEDLKWKVPVANVPYPKSIASGSIDLYSSYTAFRQYLNKDKQEKRVAEEDNGENRDNPRFTTPTVPGSIDSLQTQSLSYVSALQDSLSGWRFIVTLRGYVGIVPNSAQIGDTICILKGGRVPFTLRNSTERHRAFRLVGECYIYGIMNGEGLSLPGVLENKFRIH